MKAEKEIIGLSEADTSLKYFQRTETMFEPYWHFHPELELTFISKGEGIRYVGDSILPFSNQELVLLGENLPHQWISSTISSAYVIQFQMSDLSEIREVNQLSDLFHAAKRGLLFREQESLEQLILSLVDRTKLGRLAGMMELLDVIRTLPYQQLSSEDYVMLHGQEFDKIQRINQYVLDHMTRRITIQEVAEVAHMTRESFCRWFKRETGNTFIDFLNATKIERACRLLVEKRDTISAIAYQVGFDSISQFNRVFKQKKGTTPMSYRRMILTKGLADFN